MATYDLTTTTPASIQNGDILNCPYSGSIKTVKLPAGQYKLECWGAQGGSTSAYSYFGLGGAGGYSTGVLNLATQQTLYLIVGQAGFQSSTTVAFGGGGYGNPSSNYGAGFTGGGGTDIRIDSTSLYARVIVAGGGGGSAGSTNSGWTAFAADGGYGGGLQGGTGGTSNSRCTSTGGTQTSAGTSSGSSTNYTGVAGSFGVGANANSTETDGIQGGGGGGGWYGGAGGGNAGGGGGGGSGYVYTSSTAANYPSGCLLNSKYYLTEASTIGGSSSFLSPSGTSETGHSGNGYIRITVITLYSQVREPKTFDITTTTPDTNITGDIYNCPYSGKAITLTLSKGIYKLECWGAQGGNAQNTAFTGKGGYTTGVLQLKELTTIYCYTGQQGYGGTLSSKTYVAGTFGGGGGARGGTSGAYYNTGGGASDIRIGTDSLYARVIVAGGGGGNAQAASQAYGGYGGGLQGGTGGTRIIEGGGYGTQTAADVGAGAQRYIETPAGFGIGGRGYSTEHSNYPSSGGGGGWYGGGNGGDDEGGGGGSGYVYTSETAINYPLGCLLTPDNYLTEAETIAGNVAFLAPTGTSETGHSGNGYIRITVIQGVKLFPTMYLGEKEIVAGYLGNIPLLDVLFRQKTESDTESDTKPDEDIVVPSNITNLVTNGDFENGITGWTDMNDNVSATVNTITKSDGTTTKVLELAVTSTASVNGVTWVRSNTFTATAGHVYYARCYYKGLSTNQQLYEPKISIIEGGGSGWLVSGAAANAQVTSYTKTSAYGTCTISGSLAEVRLIATRGNTNTTIQVGNKAFFDDVVCYDLTATFGAGNEPTKEWCDENL